MKHAILILLSIFLVCIVAVQSCYIISQQKQIMHLNEQLIHIQACQEAMKAVHRYEEMERELKEWNQIDYNDIVNR